MTMDMLRKIVLKIRDIGFGGCSEKNYLKVLDNGSMIFMPKYYLKIRDYGTECPSESILKKSTIKALDVFQKICIKNP